MTSIKLHKRRGSVLIITAICLVVLLGIAALVVDIGQLRLAKQRAQNVADAAAIGGADLLKGSFDPDDPTVAEDEATAAIAAAQALAVTNNNVSHWAVLDDNNAKGVTATILQGSLTLGDGTSVTLGTNQAIQVHCKVKVDYAFAPAIYALLGESGNASGTVEATAVAMRTVPPEIPSKLIPIYVNEDYICDTSEPPPVVKLQPGDVMDHILFRDFSDISGNFGKINLWGDNSSKWYDEALAGNPDVPLVPIPINGLIDCSIIHGEMVGQTGQGFETRLKYKQTYEDWKTSGCPDTPQVVILPIVRTEGADPHAVPVVGYAAAFVDSYSKEKGNEMVTIHFITGTIVGDNWNWDSGFLNPMGENFVSTIRLVK
ncbi:MAG: Tad domain-containing protein [Armatimonadota bacterium]|nr:Tad domain-containing protein [bacterium]